MPANRGGKGSSGRTNSKASAAKIAGAVKKAFTNVQQPTFTRIPTKPKALAKNWGTEGPKKSSPRPGGVGKAGGKGKPANKRKK